MIWLKVLLSGIIGYLLGNVSSGILVAKLYGVKDIRTTGSGNAGTTNVLRTLGWVPSVLTLLGDCLKGLIAALIGRWLGGELGMLVGGTCAVLGHDFPVFFGFKGGKGIATSWGLIFAVDVRIALLLLALVLVVVAVTRYMSMGSLSAAVLYPILTLIFKWGNEKWLMYLLFALLASALTIFCHRANIERLLHGEENRLDFAKISHIKSKLGKHDNK